jgi:hypothetical protein
MNDSIEALNKHRLSVFLSRTDGRYQILRKMAGPPSPFTMHSNAALGHKF